VILLKNRDLKYIMCSGIRQRIPKHVNTTIQMFLPQVPFHTAGKKYVHANNQTKLHTCKKSTTSLVLRNTELRVLSPIINFNCNFSFVVNS
jgi:hypothetical protein